MRVIRRVAAVLALGLGLGLAAQAGASEWARVNGECKETWTRGDLLRGPTAIVNGLLRPVASFVGSTWFVAAECRAPRCAAVGPLWILGGTAWGFGEGLYWIATGLIDLPSGGIGPVSPFEASRLRLVPVVPFLSSHVPTDEERCEQ